MWDCGEVHVHLQASFTGLYLMCLCAAYDLFSILIAMVATCICVAAVIVLAVNLKRDLTE